MKSSLCFVFVISSLIQISCNFDLPPRVSQYSLNIDKSRSEDTLKIQVKNPLHTSIALTLKSGNDVLKEIFSKNGKILLEPMEVKELTFVVPGDWSPQEVITSSVYDAKIINPDSLHLTLPFPSGKEYKIVQGYNGKFSHQTRYSRYAIDFDLKVGDTITSAGDGYVVGVIELYTRGGNNRKLRDYANYITLYHPAQGVYTQYVHIMKDGSLVEVGDTVSTGQPIALSGMVGFTSTPHLHFNVVGQISDGDFRSWPASFWGGIKGMDLKAGTRVKRR